MLSVVRKYGLVGGVWASFFFSFVCVLGIVRRVGAIAGSLYLETDLVSANGRVDSVTLSIAQMLRWAALMSGIDQTTFYDFPPVISNRRMSSPVTTHRRPG